MCIRDRHNDVAADKELDLFSFQFNGKGGRFILDKNTNQGVCLENQRIKIWFDRDENNASNNNIRTTIVAFYLQDESGTIYKFSKYLKTKVLKPSYCNSNFTSKLQQPDFKNGRIYYQKSFEDVNLSLIHILGTENSCVIIKNKPGNCSQIIRSGPADFYSIAPKNESGGSNTEGVCGAL